MENNATHQFEYRLQTWGVLFLGGALVMFGLMFAFLALVNTDPLHNIVDLEPAGVKAFYWLLALLFFVGTAMLCALARRQKRNPRYIRISKDSLVIPIRPLSAKIVTIPLDSLIRVEKVSNRGISFISVRHSEGTVAIPELQLASENDFNTIFHLLSSRCDKVTA